MDPTLLQEFDQRVNRLKAGDPKKGAERKKKGLLTARERLGLLFDKDSFQEAGLHVHHSCSDFGIGEKEIIGDGVITGMGEVNQKTVAAFAQDFMAVGGTVGKMHAQKICDLMERALRLGIPVVGINDSAGARIQEGVHSLSGYGKIFNMNVELSGLVPQISIIAGPCAGGAAYSPALSDFIIITKKTSHLFICGPEVIKAATGENVTMADIGGAEVHAAVSGNAHFMAENDEEAIFIVKRLLSFFPSNNMQEPPHDISEKITLTLDPTIAELIPTKATQGYDVREVIKKVVDQGDFFEVQELFAPNIVIGFARVHGAVVGFVANQPNVKAGTIDIDAADKASRFIRFCDCFSIPIVTFMDTPGFLPGSQQERGGIIRHGAKMLFSYSAATVPKITVILRKGFGGAYLAMCSKDMGADAVYAWPSAEIAVMAAEPAVRILYKKEIDAAADPQAEFQRLTKQYRELFSSPFEAAKSDMITDVIDPATTRYAIGVAIRRHLHKRLARPPKKHGNMPL